MGENTKIEWTATVLPSGERLPGMTFNSWHGCVKVSQGCKFCYADAQDRRFGPSHWGPGAERKMMSEAYWRQPLRWNRDAAEAGVRRKVFCAFMSDVFERLPADHPSAGAVEAARERLWNLIYVTTHLDWLLLTKRPENVRVMVPPSWWGQGFPPNVWVGTSVEDQQSADTRIPHLLRVPARVRFLSCEPLLGPVDLCRVNAEGYRWNTLTGERRGIITRDIVTTGAVDWVIVGGESGHGTRPMHPDWARGLRDQCTALGVSFFFKQWGAWLPLASADEASHYPKAPLHEFEDGLWAVDAGKHAAGRRLDGRTWDEMPLGSGGAA